MQLKNFGSNIKSSQSETLCWKSLQNRKIPSHERLLIVILVSKIIVFYWSGPLFDRYMYFTVCYYQFMQGKWELVHIWLNYYLLLFVFMYNTPVVKWSNPTRFTNLLTNWLDPLWCYYAINYKLTKAESLELELDFGYFSLSCITCCLIGTIYLA